jgi:hypothetical protein
MITQIFNSIKYDLKGYCRSNIDLLYNLQLFTCLKKNSSHSNIEKNYINTFQGSFQRLVLITVINKKYFPYMFRKYILFWDSKGGITELFRFGLSKT